MSQFRELLSNEFAPYGAITDDQLRQLERHYELLLKWNRSLNLTRITNLVDSVRLHYCESLYLARFLPPDNPLTVVDVGSGAGFPGIPIAVYRPYFRIDLIEAHRRKSVFLSEAVRALKLANVSVKATRAEQVSGEYDWTVSRAVNPDEVLALKLSPDVAILGSEGAKLPWGENRALFHVKRST